MHPLGGPIQGNTLVTLTGKNFFASPLAFCRFGSSWVPAIFANTTAFICRSPVHKAGSVILTLSLNGADFVGMRSSSFTYWPGPVVLSISPEFGPKHGGTPV